MATPTIALKIGFVATMGLGTADLCLINFVLAPKLTAHPGSASPAPQPPPAAPPPSVAAPEPPAPATSVAAPATPTPQTAPDPLQPPGPEPDPQKTAPAPPPDLPAPAPEPPTASAQPTPDRLPPVRSVYFPSNGNDLDTAALAVLLDVVSALQAQPGSAVVLRGHADERGDEALNLWLSQTRAKAVANYLSHAGIASSRIKIEAQGSREPATAGHSPADWAKNRRVEIVWRMPEK